MTAIIRSALSVLLVVSVAGMNACAATGTTADGNADGAALDDCLFAVTLRDWRPLDDRNLLLFGPGRRAHHVELVRPASGLRFDVMLDELDAVYVRFGIRAPAVIDATEVESEEAEGSQRRDAR